MSSRSVARSMLGGVLVFAGLAHFTFARKAFQAQVPPQIVEATPFTADQVVLGSGVVEVALGAGLLSGKRKRSFGVLAAALFVAVFPGNLAQWREHRSAFGLDTDNKRALRLVFQPALVWLALWSTRK